MRTLMTLAAGAALILSACGGDDDDATATTPATAETTVASTEAPVTTAAAAPSTPPPAPTTATPTTAADTAATEPSTTAAAVPSATGPADPQAAAAALAWTTVFDSAAAFETKAPYLEAAAELRPTIDAYAATGTQMGGITLVPTDVAVDGATASITYDIHFAGQPAYTGQAGAVSLIDGAWIVTRDQFCAFMALARTACPT
jgi:hypothetical protein